MSSSLEVSYKETATFEEDRDRYTYHRRRHSTDEQKTCSITFQELDALRKSNKALQNALVVLDTTARTPTSDSSTQHVINAAHTSCAQTQSLVDSLFGIVPVNKKPSERSAKKAEEVFGVPELLEHILLNLSPQAILRAQQVARDWRDGVNGSGKLLRKLGILPLTPGSGFFYSPLPYDYGRYQGEAELPGVRYRADDENEWTPFASEYSTDLNPMSNEYEIQLVISARTPKLGHRCRCMLVCHPPPKKINLIAETTYENKWGRPDEIDLFSEDNVGAMTMGRLLDLVQDSIAESESNLPEDEYILRVRATLSFTLVDDDPIMLNRHERMAHAVEWAEGKKRRRRRRIAKGMHDYDSGSDREEVSSVEG